MGNLISDYVKGKKKFEYPARIQHGIALHRDIDQFTDTHASTREAREIFRPAYRLYSGAILDVIYDHFLANDPAAFTDRSLLAFSLQTYSILEEHEQWHPEKFAAFFPYMKAQNWLYNYKESWGVAKSLGGLVHRAAYLDDSDTAFALFEKHYQRLGVFYRQLWRDLRPFALSRFEMLR